MNAFSPVEERVVVRPRLHPSPHKRAAEQAVEPRAAEVSPEKGPTQPASPPQRRDPRQLFQRRSRKLIRPPLFHAMAGDLAGQDLAWRLHRPRLAVVRM